MFCKWCGKKRKGHEKVCTYCKNPFSMLEKSGVDSDFDKMFLEDDADIQIDRVIDNNDLAAESLTITKLQNDIKKMKIILIGISFILLCAIIIIVVLLSGRKSAGEADESVKTEANTSIDISYSMEKTTSVETTAETTVTTTETSGTTAETTGTTAETAETTLTTTETSGTTAETTVTTAETTVTTTETSGTTAETTGTTAETTETTAETTETTAETTGTTAETTGTTAETTGTTAETTGTTTEHITNAQDT